MAPLFVSIHTLSLHHRKDGADQTELESLVLIHLPIGNFPCSVASQGQLSWCDWLCFRVISRKHD